MAKALLDERGILTTQEGRQYLQRIIAESFGFKGFVKVLLDSAIKVGDKVFLSLPISQMAAEHLFSAVDPSAVNFRKVREISVKEGNKFKDMPYWRSARDFAKKSTRELTIFGRRYAHQPTSLLAREPQKANEQHFTLLYALEEFPTNNRGDTSIKLRSRIK